MQQTSEESLLQAIKKDDIKAFDALMEKARCGGYRLGRFPVLSLLYLYKSRKILSAYEESFLQITSFEVLREPVEVSKKFSAKAGKCLRLYLNEIVSPLEMLLILDRTKHLKQVYPVTKPSAAVRGRLKAIYSIKYSLSVKFEGENIVLERRPLSYREKKNIATVCLSVVLILVFAVGVPVTTVSLIPKPVDFSATTTYVLKKDLVLPDNYSISEVNCTIIGNGHKLILGKGASLGELKGKLSDLIIESPSDAIFTSVAEKASIENVTINVSTDVTTTESTALVALTNYGIIDGVAVNVNGRINALTPPKEDDGDEDDEEEIPTLTFGGLVLNNIYRYDSVNQEEFGFIKNCTVNYLQFTLVGESGANAEFGGIAGNNIGYLQNCTVTGEIFADTFDVAGICVVNNGGIITDSANEADISQTSTSKSWNPIVSGIAIRNTYAIENCQNIGKISAVSNCGQLGANERVPEVSAAGIVYVNTYTVAGCINKGAITATGVGTAYVGGIASYSYSLLSNCLSSGDITVAAKKIYAGGILGYSNIATDGRYIHYSVTDSCICQSKMRIDVIGTATAFVGGIIGYANDWFERTGYNEEGKIVTYKEYLGIGGVTNCYFIGEYLSNASYFGNIVGVCGAKLYESDTYISNLKEYKTFYGNYFVANPNSAFTSAFGSAENSDGKFVSVADKGATAATKEVILNNGTYKSILSALEK